MITAQLDRGAQALIGERRGIRTSAMTTSGWCSAAALSSAPGSPTAAAT
jgi:hypothetical protein